MSSGSGVDAGTTEFCSAPRSLTGPSNAVDIILASAASLVSVVVAVHISPYRIRFPPTSSVAAVLD